MRRSSSELRVATWPPPADFARTPYLVRFHEVMAAQGIRALKGFEPTKRWLSENGGKVDMLHVHWPDGLWRAGRRSMAARLPAAFRLHRFWNEARRRGIRLVWTVHNLQRHEGADWLDRRCYRALARHADVLICHSRSAADAVCREFSPGGQVVVMPMGSFPSLYPTPRPREVVSRELGLRPDVPLICALGNIRPYKGLHVACEAIQKLAGSVQLVIGGPPYRNWVDVEALNRSLTTRGLGVVVARRLTDQEFSDITAASEAVLLPYRNITGSAALLTAWTLERGVIASDLPYFREISAPDPDAAMLFAEGDAVGMAAAIESYLQLASARRRAAARRLAEHYAWERVVQSVLPIFRNWATLAPSSH